ncbi:MULTISPECIES: hypothetical protein [Saccharothrix]|uniref:hypothetical protein n=1 Tax=Saccharothrix TaxID=2071 RepID=UPI00093BDD44|nr:hypothetical protein [Saccharothrix sp. CB00851]OKI33044.1 hypothetical protein A6A25_04315 [Saccharothrix sp. CB00851]
MIFLRIVRVILIVLGIGTAALGIILIGFDARMTGGPISATWSCKSEGSGASARMTCQTGSATYAGPGGLVDTLGSLSLTVGGVVLIGAAVAIGQFDRTRISAAPAQGPAGPPAGPPLPPSGYGPQAAQGRGPAGTW